MTNCEACAYYSYDEDYECYICEMDLDEDELIMFEDMIGAVCEVERIDPDGTAWVALWWNGDEGTLTTQVGLSPAQMARV
mgnify:CR=1 FL=1